MTRFNPTQMLFDVAQEIDAIARVDEQIDVRSRIAPIASRRYMRECDVLRLYERPVYDANFEPSDM